MNTNFIIAIYVTQILKYFVLNISMSKTVGLAVISLDSE